MEQKIKNVFTRITENDLIAEMVNQGTFRVFEEGEELIVSGEYITGTPLVLEGTVKVSRINEKGEEVFLYYLQAGETCADSLQCCFTNERSHVTAVAEERTEVIIIDIRLVNQWSTDYKSWKEFLLLAFKNKFKSLLETIDAIAFQKIDERLISYLKEKQEVLNTSELQITHQEIAYDLNTSREVISRLLKTLENNGEVALGRNRIVLL